MSPPLPQNLIIRIASEVEVKKCPDIEISAAAKFRSILALADLADGPSLEEADLVRLIRGENGGLVLMAWQATISTVSNSDHETSTPTAFWTPVGFLAEHDLDGIPHVIELSVAEHVQGTGIGSSLLMALFDHLDQNQGSRVSVSLTTFKDVPWNGPWYAKHGFVQVDPKELGDEHVKQLEWEKNEAGLERPGYVRCCMVRRVDGVGPSIGFSDLHQLLNDHQ